MGLRVLSGRSPLPWYASWRIALAASDVDADVGVAAVWLAKRSRWLSAADYVCLYERDGSGWQWVGGMRGMGRSLRWRAGARPISAVVREGGSAARSYIDRLAMPSPNALLTDIGWVACAIYHAPAGITRLGIGGRQITVPVHGHALVAWKAPQSCQPPLHPHIIAMGEDGAPLAEFGPSDHFDSRTILGLTEALE
jgi:hypothetical protein